MSITLNGKAHPLAAPVTVAELLATLGLTGKPVVVEVDRAALNPGEHATAMVRDGAEVEIVVLAAGG